MSTLWPGPSSETVAWSWPSFPSQPLPAELVPRMALQPVGLRGTEKEVIEGVDFPTRTRRLSKKSTMLEGKIFLFFLNLYSLFAIRWMIRNRRPIASRRTCTHTRSTIPSISHVIYQPQPQPLKKKLYIYICSKHKISSRRKCLTGPPMSIFGCSSAVKVTDQNTEYLTGHTHTRRGWHVTWQVPSARSVEKPGLAR